MEGSKKKILILCTDDSGGAGMAMYRMLKGLKATGFFAKMLVKNKSGGDDDVVRFINVSERKIAKRLYSKLKNIVRTPLNTNPSYAFFNPDENDNYIQPQKILDQIKFTPDIILGTWTSRFLNFATIADLALATKARPYVATVDMSPLTGGCHYAWDCKGYMHTCENCPAILDKSRKDKASKNLLLKMTAVKEADIKAIAGSAWTANQVKASALFAHQSEVRAFPGLIDDKIFNSKARGVVRQLFEIPGDRKVIFAGAIDPKETRKGFKQFKEALILLSNMSEELREKVVVLVVGKNVLDVAQFPFSIKEVDYIKDERLLSYFYQASDVFVCPSLDESGPQMTLQAMACGTPVVCFQVGFGLDIIKDDYNGYAVPIVDIDAMAKGIFKILQANTEDRLTFSNNAESTIREIASLKALYNFFQKL